MSLTKTIQAFDIDGNELERGDIVQVTKNESDHPWLKVGNTLRVSYWENRPFGQSKYIVVFLVSKNGGRLCQRGLHEKSIRKVSGN
ncbi:hypothetical protein J1907_17895 [Lysinibacillus sphaericus]|uniref:hypothetical protein n=1 Tax=Lysinibacillus sphaericus TaxID=1421 RepID=UPI000566F58A|nr:hypothetical protein [Lysinibacillus sphaericus]QTB21599.1 hypothetical protein J1907_17895 [Lysinibacillus sphaericus]